MQNTLGTRSDAAERCLLREMLVKLAERRDGLCRPSNAHQTEAAITDLTAVRQEAIAAELTTAQYKQKPTPHFAEPTAQ